jgi:predicted lipoprotein with Yx(FWY)xxD motif
MRNWMAGAACAAGIVLAATACSSGSSSSAASPATSSATAQASSPAAPASSQASSTGATVALQTIKGIPHQALVDGKGRTMYLWEADKHGTSTCTGACAAAWPPVTVTGTPQAGTGVDQAKLGTVKRADGTEQLTYSGHPLYYFVGDASTGVAHGEGSKAFGADWYVVSASGAKIDTT